MDPHDLLSKPRLNPATLAEAQPGPRSRARPIPWVGEQCRGAEAGRGWGAGEQELPAIREGMQSAVRGLMEDGHEGQWGQAQAALQGQRLQGKEALTGSASASLPQARQRPPPDSSSWPRGPKPSGGPLLPKSATGTQWHSCVRGASRFAPQSPGLHRYSMELSRPHYPERETGKLERKWRVHSRCVRLVPPSSAPFSLEPPSPTPPLSLSCLEQPPLNG